MSKQERRHQRSYSFGRNWWEEFDESNEGLIGRMDGDSCDNDYFLWESDYFSWNVLRQAMGDEDPSYSN